MRARAVLLLLVLVVLSGCVGSTGTSQRSPSTNTPTLSTNQSPTTTSTTTATPTPTPTATATPTPTPVPNPFREATIDVAVTNDVNGRNFTSELRRTITYWNGHNSEYGHWRGQFRLVNRSRTSPDVLVKIVPNISYCGSTDTSQTVGCADILAHGTTARHPEVVSIHAGYTANATVEIMEHEFGHLQGIHHYESPMPLMKPERHFVHLPMVNAVDKQYAWQSRHLSVYLDLANVSRANRRIYREQAKHAIDFWNRGGDGTAPTDYHLSLTSNESAADVVVTRPASKEKYAKHYSVGAMWGENLDSDPPLEYYQRERIQLVNIQPSHTGYHIAYWIGIGLPRTQSELPATLRESSSGHAGGNWWTS